MMKDTVAGIEVESIADGGDEDTGTRSEGASRSPLVRQEMWYNGDYLAR